MKKYTLLICLLIVSGLGLVRAQENGETWFEQANAAYNAGRYDTAVILYEKVIDLGMESAPLYYNMGNAYYKKQDFPMAIYYYEKALKIDPSNEELQTNLAIANRAIVDKIEPVPESFIEKGWHNMRTWLSGNQWAWCSIIAFALFLAALLLFLRARRIGLRKLGFFTGLLFLILFGLSVVFALQLRQAAMTEDQAIIMTPTVNVKSSPSNASVDLFVLHEGTKVSILESADGWNKIRIANGSVGYLPEASMLPF